MGGVDLSDALIGYYNVLHKTSKWYKMFFLHFVDIAVVNSFILHQHLSRAQNKSPLNHKEFREKLVSELAALSSTSVAPEVLACLRPACICQSSSRAMLSRVLWVRCQEWEESLCSVQTFRPQSKDICVLYKMQCTLVLGGIQKLLQEMAH